MGPGEGDASEVVSGAAADFEVVSGASADFEVEWVHELFEAEADVVRPSEVARENSLVAVIADESMVVIGMPIESSRNLPRPLSQHMLT